MSISTGPLEAMPAQDKSSWQERFDVKWLIVGVCVLFVVFLAAVPLFFLLGQSFFTPQTSAKAAEFTFQNYFVGSIPNRIVV